MFELKISAASVEHLHQLVRELANGLHGVQAAAVAIPDVANDVPAPEPEPEEIPKPPKNKGGRRAELDRETAAKQLKGEPKGPSKSGVNGDPEADRKFVTDYLLANWAGGDPATKAKIQAFSQWVKSGHDDVGVRDLPPDAFPSIRRQLEKDFGLT